MKIIFLLLAVLIASCQPGKVDKVYCREEWQKQNANFDTMMVSACGVIKMKSVWLREIDSLHRLVAKKNDTIATLTRKCQSAHIRSAKYNPSDYGVISIGQTGGQTSGIINNVITVGK